MAHFARLDEADNVIEVIVVSDEWLNDNGVESEALGIAALQAWSGHAYWAQTSYNNNMRVRFAGSGYTFNRALNAFISPKPFASWLLDEQTASWVAPVPKPAEGIWAWDEDALTWRSMRGDTD